jgi:hypothetical protein
VRIEEEEFRFEVQVRDCHGNLIDEPTVAWSVQPENLGSFTDGLFTPTRSGDGWIIAQAEDLSDSVEVTVVHQPEQVYNYPNPVQRGNITTFRYYLNGPAEVSIDIYGLNGELLEYLPPQEEKAGGWRDRPCGFSDLAGGIYLYQCRISYEGKPEIRLPVKKLVIR